MRKKTSVGRSMARDEAGFERAIVPGELPGSPGVLSYAQRTDNPPTTATTQPVASAHRTKDRPPFVLFVLEMAAGRIELSRLRTSATLAMCQPTSRGATPVVQLSA